MWGSTWLLLLQDTRKETKGARKEKSEMLCHVGADEPLWYQLSLAITEKIVYKITFGSIYSQCDRRSM